MKVGKFRQEYALVIERDGQWYFLSDLCEHWEDKDFHWDKRVLRRWARWYYRWFNVKPKLMSIFEASRLYNKTRTDSMKRLEDLISHERLLVGTGCDIPHDAEEKIAKFFSDKNLNRKPIIIDVIDDPQGMDPAEIARRLYGKMFQ